MDQPSVERSDGIATPGRAAPQRLGVGRNVIALGWVSFFTDLASEMLYPIIPLFLVGTLGATPALLGFIDGLAEGISSGLRWLGGSLSDRFGRRKPFVLAGYALSAVSKPVMGLAQVWLGWPLLLAGRCSDRLGKSLRTAARDALIADSTDPSRRGIAFGIHRAMDTAGAVLGPLAALGILALWAGPHHAFAAHWAAAQGQSNPHLDVIRSLPLSRLFYVAVLPGLASVLLVVWVVREVRPAADRAGSGAPPAIFQKYPRPFWLLLIANAVFSLGNSSDAFLILRSAEIGLSFGPVVLAFALYNVVYAATSAPLGHLSDRIGRKRIVGVGWTVYALVYLGFAFWSGPLAPWVLLSCYGLYQALTEGVTKALISDAVPSNQRAGAIGLFYTASGLGQLAGSTAAGALWSVRLFHGRGLAPFLLGAACALAAVPLLSTMHTHSTERTGGDAC
jgi:MFS family permease